MKPPYLPEYNVISLEDIKSNGCNIVNFFVSDDFDHYLKEFKNLSLSINFFKISIYYLKLFEMLNKSNGICKLVWKLFQTILEIDFIVKHLYHYFYYLGLFEMLEKIFQMYRKHCTENCLLLIKIEHTVRFCFFHFFSYIPLIVHWRRFIIVLGWRLSIMHFFTINWIRWTIKIFFNIYLFINFDQHDVTRPLTCNGHVYVRATLLQIRLLCIHL